MERRKHNRLQRYDYSQDGYYFVTICTHHRIEWFGKIENDLMVLNEYGKIVKKQWLLLQEQYSYIKLDEFTVMPNHLHGIIEIVGAPLVGALNNDRAGTRPAPTLGGIIGAFKSMTTNEDIRNVKTNNWPSFNRHLWQRSFYDHVIRNEKELKEIREYIVNNPKKWDLDAENVGVPLRF
ncbi:MAG: transposase [Candidatus Omnitrophota bacterium]|nr:transposase [Candidatus Omnitrophota bacterium]